MRSWWDRTLEYFADYIAVYGWSDPTMSMPPTWVDDPSWDRCGCDGPGQETVRSTCASWCCGNAPQHHDRQETGT